MKGKILDYSINDNQGVISGDDGVRYSFSGKEWKAPKLPSIGSRVDFGVEGVNATAIYFDEPTPPAVDTTLDASEKPYDGFYKSSDDKMLGGVCAGLAHKWNFSRTGLRFVTLIIYPLIVPYIACWIIFPARPTKMITATSAKNELTPKQTNNKRMIRLLCVLFFLGVLVNIISVGENRDINNSTTTKTTKSSLSSEPCVTTGRRVGTAYMLNAKAVVENSVLASDVMEKACQQAANAHPNDNACFNYCAEGFKKGLNEAMKDN